MMGDNSRWIMRNNVRNDTEGGERERASEEVNLFMRRGEREGCEKKIERREGGEIG
jgi:hypothetical protein